MKVSKHRSLGEQISDHKQQCIIPRNPAFMTAFKISMYSHSIVSLYNFCAWAQLETPDKRLIDQDYFTSCQSINWISFKRRYGKLLPPTLSTVILIFKFLTVCGAICYSHWGNSLDTSPSFQD